MFLKLIFIFVSKWRFKRCYPPLCVIAYLYPVPLKTRGLRGVFIPSSSHYELIRDSLSCGTGELSLLAQARRVGSHLTDNWLSMDGVHTSLPFTSLYFPSLPFTCVPVGMSYVNQVSTIDIKLC